MFPISCLFLDGEPRCPDILDRMGRHNEEPLARRVLNRFPHGMFQESIVVTKSRQTADWAGNLTCCTLMKPCDTFDITGMIRAGVASVAPESQGVMLLFCDQPNLSPIMVKRLGIVFLRDMERIVCAGYNGKREYPVIYPRILFPELFALSPGSSDDIVIDTYPELLLPVESPDYRELLRIGAERYTGHARTFGRI